MGDEYKTLTDNLVTWMLDNMLSPQGYFYFRKMRYYTNRIPYMRWSQAWAFLALTQYLSACHASSRSGTAKETAYAFE